VQPCEGRIPKGPVSRNVVSSWLKSSRTALLTVPSMIIDEEDDGHGAPGASELRPDQGDQGSTFLGRLSCLAAKAGVAIKARAATGNKLILSVSLTPSKSGSGLIETDPQVPVGPSKI
jgi:hypothetical protein